MRTFIVKLLAFGLMVVTGYLAATPKLKKQAAEDLADRFSFDRKSLNDVREAEVAAATPITAERFQHLEYYLTAFLPTGASFLDLDGDGFPNEACTTDAFSRKIRLHHFPVGGGSFRTIELENPSAPFGPGGALATGCLPGDYNRDGKTDLLIYFWGRTPVIYLNTDGRFAADQFRMVELAKTGERWYTQSAARGDVDGDGDIDIVFSNYFPDDAKILNDSTEGESLMNKGLGAAFNGAVNRLMLNTGAADQPVFEEEKGIFADPELSGTQWTIATAVIDLDGDLLPEILFLNDHGTDRILHNVSRDGKPAFRPLRNRRDPLTPKSSTLGRDDYHAMGVDFADLNRDGAIDWVVSNFGADYLFHQSHFAWINTGQNDLYGKGMALFRDEAASLGLATTSWAPWDVRCADFDNDGKTEIYRSIGFMRGNTNRMAEITEMALVNDLLFQFPEAWHKFGPDDSLVSGPRANAFFAWSNGRYHDIGESLGLLEEKPSRGAACGDFDRDGRVDLLVTNQRASSTLYHNQSDSVSFIGLDIRIAYNGTSPGGIAVLPPGREHGFVGRPAIGARVEIQISDNEKVADLVDGGSGYGGKKNPEIHVGLGAQVRDDQLFKVSISWRNLKGEVQNNAIHVKPGWHTVWLDVMEPTKDP